jgi:hypothetical protein
MTLVNLTWNEILSLSYATRLISLSTKGVHSLRAEGHINLQLSDSPPPQMRRRELGEEKKKNDLDLE